MCFCRFDFLILIIDRLGCGVFNAAHEFLVFLPADLDAAFADFELLLFNQGLAAAHEAILFLTGQGAGIDETLFDDLPVGQQAEEAQELNFSLRDDMGQPAGGDLGKLLRLVNQFQSSFF